MTASLNEKLSKIEWGEYRLGGEKGLFDVNTVKSYDEGKLELFGIKQANLIEFVGRTRTDNGIKGYVGELDTEPNPEDVISVSQIGTIVAQLRKEKWYASQNMFILNPKLGYGKLISLFGVLIINKSLSEIFSEGYSNYPTLGTLKNLKIKLPTKNGKIDFEFMNNLITELEAERIAELEAYLVATGLKDYTLTSEEEKMLKDFDSGEFELREFKIGKLFEINHYGKQRSQNDLQKSGKLRYNFVMQNENNNGIIERVPEQVGNDFNLIPGNSISAFTHLNKVYYQEESFYSKQGSNIYTLRNTALNKQRAKFIISAINFIIGEIEYGKNTASRLETYNISLPTKNNEPDYTTMETFISAIQKLVIKDVVQYADRKIAATKSVVEK